MMIRWRCLGQEGASCSFFSFIFFFLSLLGGLCENVGDWWGGVGLSFFFECFLHCLLACLFSYWSCVMCDATISMTEKSAGCIVVMTLGVVCTWEGVLWDRGQIKGAMCYLLYSTWGGLCE